jgi:uncharacterized membrane protein YcaP (DUF421 family)
LFICLKWDRTLFKTKKNKEKGNESVDGLIHLTIELIVGFFALLIIMKILGKTQISHLTPFDFISSLVIGELVGNAIYDKEVGLVDMLYAITVWGILIYIIELVTQKLKFTRSFLESKPSIIIRKGKIDYNQLKKNRLDLNQLQNLIRQHGIFSIRELEYAVLESNGNLSILRKSKYDQPTRNDFILPNQDVHLPVTLIMDGEVLWDNLRENGLNESWLLEQLSEYKIKHPKDVLYADWIEGQGLFLQEC